MIIDFTTDEGWERLGHGYQVESRVVLSEASDVLAVPLTALFRDGEHWAVFVDDGGRARLQHVETGQRDGVIAEIINGLESGDRVIAHPSDRVVDGVRIASRS